MEILKAIYHYISTIIKIIILLVLSPFLIIYFLFKKTRYYRLFSKELKKYGLDKKSIKELKKSCLKISDLLKREK